MKATTTPVFGEKWESVRQAAERASLCVCARGRRCRGQDGWVKWQGSKLSGAQVQLGHGFCHSLATPCSIQHSAKCDWPIRRTSDGARKMKMDQVDRD